MGLALLPACLAVASLAAWGVICSPTLGGTSVREPPGWASARVSGPGSSGAQPGGPEGDAGKKLFEAKCAACHTIGKGDSVGPDLRGVTSRRSRTWLADLISDPAGLLSHKDPEFEKLVSSYHGLVMPKLGLSTAEIGEVLDYLSGASGEPGAATKTGVPPAKPGAQAPAARPAPAAQVSPGSAASGKSLFWGKSGFVHGGLACMGCHDTAGGDTLGGGSLGPDLTHAYVKYGGQGLDGVLASMPFPVMAPLFRLRPLVDTERADLVAYFMDIATLSPRSASETPIVLSAAGFLALLLLILLATRIRARGVRRSLVRPAPAKRGKVP